jgi:hypothetical protein
LAEKIKFSEIELAFDYVSSVGPCLHSAYVSRTTGQMYFTSELGDSDELPDDLFSSDDYVEIPHKNDLDLGQRLVWRFVRREIPDHKDTIDRFFSRRGAYSRYKDFLERIGMLEKWWDFEATQTRETLLEWCEDNDLDVATK